MTPSLVFLSLLLVLVVGFSWGRFVRMEAALVVKLALVWVGIFLCGALLLKLMGLPARWHG